jgi:hypothetical protein
MRNKENMLDDGNYIENGILYNRLGRVVDPGLCREYGWTAPAGQEAAYSAYCEKVVAEYRAARRNAPVSDEEAFEMRAAFGPGVEVVNVLTGRKHRT